MHVHGYTPLASGHTLLPNVTPHPSPLSLSSITLPYRHSPHPSIRNWRVHEPSLGRWLERSEKCAPASARGSGGGGSAGEWLLCHPPTYDTYHSLHALSWQVWEGKQIDCQCYLQPVEWVIQRLVQFLCNRSCRWRVDFHPYIHLQCSWYLVLEATRAQCG